MTKSYDYEVGMANGKKVMLSVSENISKGKVNLKWLSQYAKQQKKIEK